jgi:hypothetical protein
MAPKIPKGAADEIAELAAKAMKQLMESKAGKTVVSKVDDVASGASNAVKDAIASLRGRNKLGQVEFDFTSDNFKMLPQREQAALRRQANKEMNAARSDKATAEYKEQKAKNVKAKTDQVDKAIKEIWSVETKKGYGRPALIRQIEGKNAIIDRSARVTEDTAGALDFAVEKSVRKEITKFKEDGYILDKAEIKELVKDAWAFELNKATNGLRANTKGLSTRMKNLAKLSDREIDDAAARLAYRQQTNSGKAGNAALPDYMAEKVRSKAARDLRINRAKEYLLESERTAAAAAKSDAKLGKIIKNRGPRESTGKKVESRAGREKRLRALQSERRLVRQQKANESKGQGLFRYGQQSEKAYATTQAKADAAANKIALDKAKAAERTAKDTGIPAKVVKPKEKPAEPIRNSKGETTEELNARLKRHQENFNMTNWVETVNRTSKNNGKNTTSKNNGKR